MLPWLSNATPLGELSPALVACPAVARKTSEAEADAVAGRRRYGPRGVHFADAHVAGIGDVHISGVIQSRGPMCAPTRASLALVAGPPSPKATPPPAKVEMMPEAFTLRMTSKIESQCRRFRPCPPQPQWDFQASRWWAGPPSLVYPRLAPPAKVVIMLWAWHNEQSAHTVQTVNAIVAIRMIVLICFDEAQRS